ncbi:MAG: DEAD/DEAH box helicase, partial [Xanthomonadales bacterium]|nr:DEAD/DEAH box helicase [Xanthomonadales bacterium]
MSIAARALPVESAGNPVLALQQHLQHKGRGELAAAVTLPARPGVFAPLPDELHPGLKQALQARGIERLYSHQAQAWAVARSDQDLLIATPTASGKSLCYNLPVLQSALEQRSKALYLFPTKAL